MQDVEVGLGRVFILRLQEGDRLPDVLETFADQRKVTHALCVFLGGVKEKGKVIVGPEDSHAAPINPIVKLLDGVHEVCGIGTIITDETDKPTLHMHASFGRDDRTITGCIRMGIEIWAIGEIVLLELITDSAHRVRHRQTGLEFLEISPPIHNSEK